MTVCAVLSQQLHSQANHNFQCWWNLLIRYGLTLEAQQTQCPTQLILELETILIDWCLALLYLEPDP